MEKHQYVIVMLFVLTALLLTQLKADTKFLYEIKTTTNQTRYAARYEKGELENVGTEDEALTVKGIYKIIHLQNATERRGFRSEVEYTADKNGYRVRYKLVPFTKIDNRLGILALKAAGG